MIYKTCEMTIELLNKKKQEFLRPPRLGGP
jgi:hypothetical protein